MKYRASNVTDLEFDLSHSLKDKSNGTFGLPIDDFLLVFNSLSVAVYVVANSVLPLITGPNFDPSTPMGDFFFKIESSHLWVRGKSP